MNNKPNSNKREAMQDVLALLNGATGTVSNKTSEAHTDSALTTDDYRRMVDAEVKRIMDQHCERLKATFKPFGIDLVKVRAGLAIPMDVKGVYEKLLQAQIAPDNERSSQAGRQQ